MTTQGGGSAVRKGIIPPSPFSPQTWHVAKGGNHGPDGAHTNRQEF